ncbi:MAG: hypothetical protein GXP31_13460 [Kiritimatiellaeota bacterium]|nr:hypothetical protein [Kiritimatiellota bacterium]
MRKLTHSGCHVGLSRAAFDLPFTDPTARMFTRWCRKNVLQYMMQHWEMGLVVEYKPTNLSLIS